jgi:hypothetical protein
VAIIPGELVDFLEAGVSLIVAARDSDGRPVVTRGVGASVHENRREVTVYLHEEWAASALANLREHFEIAVGFARPIDHFALQLKGTCTRFLAPAEGDRAVVERYHAAYSEQLSMIGLPRSVTRRFRMWPAVGVTFAVRDIFVQTPGPEAGRRCEPAASGK